jgi:hypothetical protein
VLFIVPADLWFIRPPHALAHVQSAERQLVPKRTFWSGGIWSFIAAAFDFASARTADHRAVMRRFLLVLTLVFLGGCAKPQDLPDITVRASTSAELAAFRAELGERFTAGQLQPIDTAFQELQLDAMNRGVTTAEAREEDMLAAVNGQTIRATLVLGWKVRRERILREIVFTTAVREQNLKIQQQTAAAGTPLSVVTHLQNAREILERLQHDLTDTEQRLARWGQAPTI